MERWNNKSEFTHKGQQSLYDEVSLKHDGTTIVQI